MRGRPKTSLQKQIPPKGAKPPPPPENNIGRLLEKKTQPTDEFLQGEICPETNLNPPPISGENERKTTQFSPLLPAKNLLPQAHFIPAFL